jgi:hypothetical protein
VYHNWVMIFGLIPLLHEWRAATYSSLFLVPIIRICPSSGCSIHMCPFSPFPQHAHLMCFATSSQSFALRLPLTVKVRLLPLHSRPCSLSPLDAAPLGTVRFTSPLYRSNLHYKIIQKPSVSAQVVKSMVNYILERYPNETGIVYCLSRKVSQIPCRHCRALVSWSSLRRTRSRSRLSCLPQARDESRQVSTTPRSRTGIRRNCTRVGV